MAAAPGEAQMVVCTTAGTGANRRRALPQRCGRSLLFLSISHIRPCLLAMHSQAGERHGLHAKDLRRGRASGGARRPGRGQPSSSRRGSLAARWSQQGLLPPSSLPARTTAPSAARPAGWPPRTEGAECLQAPHRHAAAQLALKQPF